MMINIIIYRQEARKENSYKKPWAEKKLAQMLPASIVIISESGAPVTTPKC